MVSLKTINRTVQELINVGLPELAKELKSKKHITYEELSIYDAKLTRKAKENAGIIKTEWEKKIVEKLSNRNGEATPDCWFTDPDDNKELAKIELEQDKERDWVDETTCFGFYTYVDEVCILSDCGYDSDFDSFPEAFQKKVWEIIESGKYEEE